MLIIKQKLFLKNIKKKDFGLVILKRRGGVSQTLKWLERLLDGCFHL